MRTTSEPASHRCVLGMGRWRCGSIVATLTRPASLHYSVVVQERSTAPVLGGGRRNRTFTCPMDPTGSVVAIGRNTHGIRGAVDRRQRVLQLDDVDARLRTGKLRIRHETPRFAAEGHGSASPTAIAMQLG